MGTFMDQTAFEYPCHGTGDYREPCLMVMDNEGMTTCDLRYVSHKVYKGKPVLDGLPATFANEDEAETLEITCIDKGTCYGALQATPRQAGDRFGKRRIFPPE